MERLSKQDSGGTITYMYDMDKVVLERDAQDTTVTSYSPAAGRSSMVACTSAT